MGPKGTRQALANKQEAAARLLLERGADPSLADSVGWTPLMYAAMAGSVTMVELLLGRRVPLDCADQDIGCTAFHCACAEGHADVVEALVRAGCDTAVRTEDGATGRQLAEQQGHASVVERLRALEPEPEPEELQPGTAVEIDGLIGAAQHNGKGGVVESLDFDSGRYTVRLIGEGKRLRVKRANLVLVAGDSILNAVAQMGDTGLMAQLLDGGANPNALVPTDLDDPTRPGQELHDTALIAALDNGQEAAARLLLERGADPSLADTLGQTPLMTAARVGSVAMVEMLLGRRVPLDCHGQLGGGTAFHNACHQGHADVAKALARAGCDTTARDKLGMTGRQQAIVRGHALVAERLRALKL